MAHNRLNDMDFHPVSKQENKTVLMTLLNTPKIRTWFCWHNWVYWTFGPATKVHRVCSKCFKKQQNNDIIKTSNIWRKETHY